MHIPDGFLDPLVSLATYAIFLAFASIAILKLRKNTDNKNYLEISFTASAIFVAQMLNWPIPGGTSAHFVGSALSGILYGVWVGFIIMTLVLLVQALVFRDGGITTLGANVLNMGIIAVLVGYLVYRFVSRSGIDKRKVFLGGFFAGWLSAFAAGVACGFEIGLSTHFPFGVFESVVIMGIWHFFLGVVEGLITGSILIYLFERGEFQ